MATLTSANSVYMLGIFGIFSTAVQLQGFEVDDAFSTDDVVNSETKMGLDGHLSVGWVPMAVNQTITLQADSPSISIFDLWATTQAAAREASIAFGTISLPGVGAKYVCIRGVLTRYKPMPDVKKILQARTFGLTWESVLPSPI